MARNDRFTKIFKISSRISNSTPVFHIASQLLNLQQVSLEQWSDLSNTSNWNNRNKIWLTECTEFDNVLAKVQAHRDYPLWHAWRVAWKWWTCKYHNFLLPTGREMQCDTHCWLRAVSCWRQPFQVHRCYLAASSAQKWYCNYLVRTRVSFLAKIIIKVWFVVKLVIVQIIE